MRAFIAGLGLAFILSMVPSVALADGGEDGDVQSNNEDPGITALHTAVKDMKDVTAALRSECPDRADAKCKAAFKAARDAFKAAREKAIAEHHAFKEEQKKAREAAKQKAKDALKDKVTTQAKDRAARNHRNDDKDTGNTTLVVPKPVVKESPKPSATPRG